MVLRARGGRLERISQNSPSYSALHYVLLFPKGENGWHPRIPIRGAQLRERGENARQRDGEKWARSQVVSVMNIEWDYSYYQPWSDNEWLVDEMMAMQEEALMARNEDITMQ